MNTINYAKKMILWNSKFKLMCAGTIVLSNQIGLDHLDNMS